MQENLPLPKDRNNYQWLEIAEILSVVGAIGGSIASVVTQQVVFASIPLSLAATLNLLNRRQLLNSIQQSYQREIAQIVQENANTQAKLMTLTERLAEVKQTNPNLQGSTDNLHKVSQFLRKEQMQIAKVVGLLKQLESHEQTIRNNPNHAQAYYSKGLAHQTLGNQEAAVYDYTEAIRCNPSYAEAYYNRGLIRAELGDKKAAFKDLREAAKLFLEQGNIADYEKAKESSHNVHGLNLQPKKDSELKVTVENVFS